MASLVESLSRIASRVEILASGVEGERRAAEAMMAQQRPLDARDHARAILAKVPGSALGLALWADAAEALWLDEEAVEALGALAAQVPWRADVWLRLGRAGLRVGWDGARDALERAATAPDERWARRRALLDLADIDLEWGDPGRAEQWLDRLPQSLTGGRDEAALLRRAECALARGAIAEAADLALGVSDRVGEAEAIAESDPEREAARRSLLFARVAWGEGAFSEERPPGSAAPTLPQHEALEHAVRAYVLEARGAKELFAAIAATTRDAKVLGDLARIVRSMGQFDEPSMVAAFALAEGRRADARAALVRALDANDPVAPAALARLAVETRDAQALALVLDRRSDLVPRALVPLVRADRALREADPDRALEALDALTDPSARAWASALAESAYAMWLKDDDADWDKILAALLEGARQVGSAQDLAAIEALSSEVDKPIALAVVGEFNAGKSTFINAFLGVDVAPTGVLPTTATLHRVAWAPDPFARVLVRGAPDRVVSHEALKATLAALIAEGKSVSRVQIYAPIERLRWVEIIDTPGFNAPDPEHAKAARSAFEDTHAVVWLLDATQPLKASEAGILSELCAAGLPLLVILNKLDRLAPGDDARVLEHTTRGLAELGIVPRAPPMLMSARLALRARIEHDADTASAPSDVDATLAKSRWPLVEAEIGRVVVDDADTLRERAMRRRAARIAASLAEAARVADGQDLEAGKLRAQRVDSLRAAAQRIVAEEDALVGATMDALAEPRRGLASDLRPITQIAEASRDEDGVRAYVAARASARLGQATVDAVAKLSSVPSPALAAPLVLASIEAAALAMPSAPWGPTEERAAIRGAVRAAGRAYALAALEEPAPHAAARWVARLGALAAALERASGRP